jgi:alkanesulfonate monooxygenase SsuD/methylene tetrahydromethanopterin reductase-like flavin-dependent oxidoreductase (luciferase family)
MTFRPFRFGVSLLSGGTPAAWQSKVQQAADLGYDVVQVPDHLGMSAPFPALVSAASVLGPRLGTFVLNAGFYRPALLARDVAETSRLLEGRLELGSARAITPRNSKRPGCPSATPASESTISSKSARCPVCSPDPPARWRRPCCGTARSTA